MPAIPPTSVKELPQPPPAQPRLPYHPNYTNVQSGQANMPPQGPHHDYQQQQQYAPPPHSQYMSNNPQGSDMMMQQGQHMQRAPIPNQPHHPPPQPNYPGFTPHGVPHMQYQHGPMPQPHQGYPGHMGKPMPYEVMPPTYDDRKVRVVKI